jgi:hypothetical protein
MNSPIYLSISPSFCQLTAISLTRYSGGKSLKYKRVPESEKCIYIHEGGWQYNGDTDEGTAAGIENA